MTIINKITGAEVAHIVGGNSMTLDEAIESVGTYHGNEQDYIMTDRADVEIGGNWYYYDDLDTVTD